MRGALVIDHGYEQWHGAHNEGFAHLARGRPEIGNLVARLRPCRHLNGLLRKILGRNRESIRRRVSGEDRLSVVPNRNADDWVFVGRGHVCFEHAVRDVDRLDLHTQRLVTLVDRGLPLHALVIGAGGGDDDLVLDRQRTEIDRNAPGCTQPVDDLLAVDSHGDARVIEAGDDGQIDGALDVTGRRAVAIHDELSWSGACCRRKEEGESDSFEKWATALLMPHKSADIRIGSG